jgi:hypothetical protein
MRKQEERKAHPDKLPFLGDTRRQKYFLTINIIIIISFRNHNKNSRNKNTIAVSFAVITYDETDKNLKSKVETSTIKMDNISLKGNFFL